jgi:hypothetical protein
MKQCTKCKIDQDLCQFRKHKSTKDGFTAWCKSCHKNYYKNWKGRTRYLERSREYYLKYHYNLTITEVPSYCDSCGSTEKICVDHDHTTLEIRGFLCDNCNLILGKSRDNPVILENLAKYIRRSKFTGRYLPRKPKKYNYKRRKREISNG